MNSPFRMLSLGNPLFWTSIALGWLALTASGVEKAQADDSKGLSRVVLARFAVEDKNDGKVLMEEMLGRMRYELYRQAMFIAAWDECGLDVRDETLGETPFSESHPIRFSFEMKEQQESPLFGVWLNIYEGEKASDKPLLSERLHYSRNNLFGEKTAVSYDEHARDAERFSREAFLEMLIDQGAKRQPRRDAGDGTVDDTALTHLNRLEMFSQFLAVRQLHRQIREQGESPARLGALVRAYANLGLLSEHHWHPAHKVFKARALLYGHRLLNQYPDDPHSHWNQAYALTLIGLHFNVQGYLSSAAQKNKKREEADRLDTPPWVRLLSAHCDFNPDRLERSFDDAELGSLARLLAFVNYELAHEQQLATDAGLVVLQASPENLRVNDTICRVTGIGLLRQTCSLAFGVMPPLLYARVSEVEGLPESCEPVMHRASALLEGGGDEQDVVREWRIRAELIKALREPAATNETTPSPGTLSMLVEEAGFLHVWHQARLLTKKLGVPAEDFLISAHPLIQSHRYRDLMFVWQSIPDRVNQLERRILRIDARDFDFGYRDLLLVLGNISKPAERHFYQHALQNGDALPREVSGNLTVGQTHFDSKRLLVLSPKCPTWTMALINLGAVDPRWETQFDQWPQVQKSFAAHYMKKGKTGDAIRCLKRSTELSPDSWGFRTLAKLYAEQNDRVAWKETLDAYLQQPDYGLGHARAQVEIARYLMGLEDHQQALPYAEAAAETYAEWGMEVLIDCYTELEEWEKAEAWIVRRVQRYPHSALTWFDWCLDYGHGNQQLARRVAAGARAGLEESDNFQDWKRAGYFRLAEDDLQGALVLFQKAIEAEHRDYNCLHVAVILHGLKRPEERDAMLVRAEHAPDQQKGPDNRPYDYRGIARLLHAAYQDGGLTTKHLETIDQATQKFPPIGQYNISYYVGRLLELDGEEEKARKLYLHASQGPNFLFNTVLSRIRLRKMAPQEDAATEDQAEPATNGEKATSPR
jgi:lipopolysaccharide biosynthesis regulator YciM